MKKLSLVLAAFGMAAFFTACGDDDSSTTSSGSSNIRSCDMSVSVGIGSEILYSTHICAEGPVVTDEDKAEFEQTCTSEKGEDEGILMDITAKQGTSCPNGAVVTCEGKDGSKVYYYDKDAKGKTCAELDEEMDL